MTKIEEYKKLLEKLWCDLEDNIIDSEEYHAQKRNWLKNNADEELFDYFIDLYKGRPIEKEYIRLKKEILGKE